MLVVVYWWVGDLTEAGLATENADFVVTPPGWSAATVRVAAIGCLGVVLVTAGVLISPCGSGCFVGSG